jgi:hypothetical protein
MSTANLEKRLTNILTKDESVTIFLKSSLLNKVINSEGLILINGIFILSQPLNIRFSDKQIRL